METVHKVQPLCNSSTNWLAEALYAHAIQFKAPKEWSGTREELILCSHPVHMVLFSP